MTKKLFGLVLVAAVLATLTAGTALAAAKEAAGDDSNLPGQDYFTLVGTIETVQPIVYSPEGELITVKIESITVLLHNGNRFIKPVDEGDSQTVQTTPDTVYNQIDPVRGTTVSIHGTVVENVDGDDVFIAERVTVGVPCPACPVVPPELP